MVRSVAVLCGCAPLVMWASAAGATAAEDLAALAIPSVEIVVVGSVGREEIPGSASLVSAQDLERSRVFTVNDALRMVPGVFARDEEGVGARPNIGIRGLNPTRSTKVLLLEDGIPLAFAPYGDNASYYHPPIERFSGIEVLKGASQIRFGPQTIGGVVNYLTPDVPDTLSLRATGTVGNRETINLDGQFGVPVGDGGVLLHVNHKASEGSRDNQKLRFTDIFLKGSWTLGENQAVTIKLSHFDENSQVSYSGLTRDEFSALPRGNPFRNDRFTAQRTSGVVIHRWDLSSAVTLRTAGYYHHFSRDWWRQSSNSGQRPADASDLACGGMVNIDTGCGNEGRLRDYDTWGVESRLVVDHDGIGIGIGGETEVGVRFHEERQRRRQWNGDTPTARTPGSGVNAGVRENNERDTGAVAVFGQSRLDFGRFAIVPGIRAEFIDYSRRNLPVDVLVAGRPSGVQTVATGASSAINQVVPGIGATFDLAPDVVVYGGVHRGFAPPRVEDIITTAGGSVDLGAELSWNWEVGVRGSLVPGIKGDATFFVMDFSNQIVAQSVAGGIGTTLTSAGRTLHRGGEVSLAVSSRDAGWTTQSEVYARMAATWLPTVRYASTRIATAPCFDGAAPLTPVATGSGPRACGQGFNAIGNRLPYSPEWLVSAAIGMERGGVQGQVELVAQSKMFADDVNLIPVTPDGQRGEIPGWAVVNLALSYRPPESRWEVFATARNVFDRLTIADRARGTLPGPPRLIQAGVILRY